MSRWEPGARDRLERAALDLFLERGFDQTTVPQIAARAGLTTRTFFRHFADKREVLFAGQDEVPALVADLIARAPAAMEPMDVITWGFQIIAPTMFQDRGDYPRKRRTVIDSNEGLRERELGKLANLSDAINRGFQTRGSDDLTATLAAEIAVAVFKVAVRRWIDQTDGDLSAVIAETINALNAVTAAPGPHRRRVGTHTGSINDGETSSK